MFIALALAAIGALIYINSSCREALRIEST